MRVMRGAKKEAQIYQKKKICKLCPREIWQLEQSFLAKGNTKQQA